MLIIFCMSELFFYAAAISRSKTAVFENKFPHFPPHWGFLAYFHHLFSRFFVHIYQKSTQNFVHYFFEKF